MKEIRAINDMKCKMPNKNGIKRLYNVRSVTFEPKESMDDIVQIIKLFKHDNPSVLMFKIPNKNETFNIFGHYHPIEESAIKAYFKNTIEEAIAVSFSTKIFDSDCSSDSILIYHVGGPKK